MKSYKKPTVSVVSLKSSEDIALTYKDIESQLISGTIQHKNQQYAVTMFTLKNSN